MGGSSKKVTVGYKYYLGAHLILCHGPVDKITRIEVDGKTAWSGNATGGPISINAPNLFGGESREGGVSGTVDIEMGRPTQGRNAYLQGRLGADIPAYRGVVGAVLRQVYVGLNPYLKRWAFWASRIHTRQNGQPQWYDEKAEINGDMNPAHIIRECLTDRDWGMGYPETDIDDASFRAAADRMHAEGMGMSLLWDRSTSLEDFLKEVLKHIDGSLYVDRVTGKFTLKLARGDYDINNLLVLDESSIERITDFQRTAPGDLVNSVTVVYWDANTGKNNSVTVQDIALTAQQQAVVGTTLQYPGFTRGDIASRVASRELTALSTPLASATIYANRKAASLNIGDVFVLSWPRYGITRMVMRVANIELGSLDKNAVKIQAVEDVFALPQAVYAPPPPSAWENPVTAPTPCPHHSVVEAPYWELVQRMGETDAAAVPPTSGYVVATGTRPSGSATNARLYTNPTNTAWEDAGAVDFCPYARLAIAATPTATVLAIDSGIDLDLVQPGTYAIIDDEIARVDAVTSTTLTVGRGVLDTVAAPHAAGAHILFTDAYCETDAVEYAIGETARIRLLPVTGTGTLDVAAAPTQTVTIAGRHAKPYPPGRLRINNQAYPAVITGPLSLSWAHRDRLQQTATLISEEAGNIGPEQGVTYNLRLYGENNNLVHVESGLTGTSYIWDSEETVSGLPIPGSQSNNPDWPFVTALLHFDGPDNSTIFRDERGNRFTASGTARIRTNQSKFGGASAFFDGSPNCHVTADPSDRYRFGTENFTIDIWAFVLPSIQPWGRLLENALYNDSTLGWLISFNGTDPSGSRRIGFQLSRPGGGGPLIWSDSAFPTNTWTHFAVERVGNTVYMYINGVRQSATMDMSGRNLISNRLRLGFTLSGEAGYYVGYMDELQITKKARYGGANFTPQSEPFTGSALRLNGRVRIELDSERDGLTSYQKHSIMVERGGYGYNYGKYYGGV